MDPSSELLNQLEGLELPDSTGLGIAPGWWLLLLILLLLFVGFYLYRHRKTPEPKAADWRPAAHQELARIKASLTTATSDIVLADCSRVARRIALVAAPREEIASLHGDAWMQKLDALSGTSAFTEGQGQLLHSGPYKMKPGSVGSDEELADLRGLVTELEGLLRTVSGDTS